MIERAPILNIVTHLLLIIGLLMAAMPIYIVAIAATHDLAAVNKVPMSLIPGGHAIENFVSVWQRGRFGETMVNSLIVATAVAVGKVFIAALSAFSIVFFRYRLRMAFFWIIFVTLMLPLEVRIVPTYAVASNILEPVQTLIDVLGFGIALPQVNLLNTYAGLILPLIATATGTFLYRQFFMTIPEELAEAAKMDGAGAWRFFSEIVLPLSRANMAALFTIMFVYAWNQYLWPLLVTTDARMATMTMQLQKIVPNSTYGQAPVWNEAMAATLLVMLPPLIVVILMQGYFVRGLIATEK